MSKAKARLVTAVIFAFVMVVSVDFIAIYPKALNWILGAFAVPGAWKFCRVCYIWLQEEEKPLTYQDYARAAGVHEKPKAEPKKEATA